MFSHVYISQGISICLILLNKQKAIMAFMVEHTFVLSEFVKKRLETLGFNLVCYCCQKKLEPGQLVMSNGYGARTVPKRRYYHADCHEAMYLDIGVKVNRVRC
jgi:hypothetical protein